jgi:predicted adenine nucleotide alpha hydrolase (AANH) superfamily ATPase
MEKLLLHTCCGPCLSGAELALSEDQFDTTAFFFNPNIQPVDEHGKRLAAFRKFTTKKNIKAVEHDNPKSSPIKAGDCETCYRVRLNEAAKYAKEKQFDSFSTTLLISPYQKHDLIRSVGECFSQKYSMPFHYVDMRPFYRESVRISKEQGLYRQKYCGCLYSRDMAMAGSLLYNNKNEQIN